jgi:hypothetical protein
LEVCGALSEEENATSKQLLDRIVAMLTKLGQRGYSVREKVAGYSEEMTDTDTDSDPETAQ